MKYTVVWAKSAEAVLATNWLGAEDREAIRHAADQIDALLRSDPISIGKRYFSGKRMLYVPPLAVEYKVSMADRMVFVLSVWIVSESQNGQPK